MSKRKNSKRKSTRSATDESGVIPTGSGDDRWQTLRLAMECVGSTHSANANRRELPSTTAPDSCDPNTLSQMLIKLATTENTNLAAQIDLLVKFDEMEGWRESGSRSCVAWMNTVLNIDGRSAWERLRVGRELKVLPLIQKLFRNGRLSWSKVRILTRIAHPDNERELAHASLDASVNDVSRLQKEYYWDHELTNLEDRENALAELQYERRRFTWQTLADGNMQFTVVLPPEKAQAVLNSLEHCEGVLYEDEIRKEERNPECCADSVELAADTESCPNSIEQEFAASSAEITPSQRKADALVMMAESSLAYCGNELTQADRYQVILNIDAKTLAPTLNENRNLQVNQFARNSSDDQALTPSLISQKTDPHDTKLEDFIRAICKSDGSGPAAGKSTSETEQSVGVSQLLKRPYIEGAGPIAMSIAREISCDCSMSTIVTDDGEPLSIGRKSRIWPASMRRTILLRDRHCQFPGCTSHRHLHIHHIVHWADGGETSVENGVTLCGHHHRLIHTGKFSIERATVPNPGEQVDKPKGTLTTGLFSAAKKKLMPTRCRYIVKSLNTTLSASNDSLDELGARGSAYKTVHSSHRVHVYSPDMQSPERHGSVGPSPDGQSPESEDPLYGFKPPRQPDL